MSKYKAVTRGDFEAYIGPCSTVGAKEVDISSSCKEIVYERAVITTQGIDYSFKIRIYTSINQHNDECRDKGKDAIRVQLIDLDNKSVKTSTRINRVGDKVMERVVDRVREMFKYAIDPANQCPKCDHGRLVLRIPRQYMKWKAFKGCHRYPKCKGSGKLNE